MSCPAPPAAPTVVHASPVPKYLAAPRWILRCPPWKGGTWRHTPAAGGACGGLAIAARETRIPQCEFSRAAFPSSGRGSRSDSLVLLLVFAVRWGVRRVAGRVLAVAVGRRVPARLASVVGPGRPARLASAARIVGEAWRPGMRMVGVSIPVARIAGVDATRGPDMRVLRVSATPAGEARG